MLRLIVLTLLLLNAAYYAFSQGLLAPYGFGPGAQAEPQRMAQQIKPESLRILNPPEAVQPPPIGASGASGTSGVPGMPGVQAVADSGPAECLQAGVFNEEQTVVLRESLRSALPPNSWVLEEAIEPARWLVYMGKYSNDEALAKKRSELRGLGVAFEALDNAALAPGLLLGSFTTRTDAEQSLARIARKGVKTAKVLEERAEQRGQRLKLPAVNTALRSQLDAIKPQLAGKAFGPCT